MFYLLEHYFIINQLFICKKSFYDLSDPINQFV
jgi:hypothetical protein